VGHVVDEVVLGTGLFPRTSVSHVSIIPAVTDTCISFISNNDTT
jgi:hypothetical protein